MLSQSLFYIKQNFIYISQTFIYMKWDLIYRIPAVRVKNITAATDFYNVGRIIVITFTITDNFFIYPFKKVIWKNHFHIIYMNHFVQKVYLLKNQADKPEIPFTLLWKGDILQKDLEKII